MEDNIKFLVYATIFNAIANTAIIYNTSKNRLNQTENETEEVDYHVIIYKDSIKLKDLKGAEIYKDTFNWTSPNKIEQAIIKDNL